MNISHCLGGFQLWHFNISLATYVIHTCMYTHVHIFHMICRSWRRRAHWMPWMYSLVWQLLQQNDPTLTTSLEMTRGACLYWYMYMEYSTLAKKQPRPRNRIPTNQTTHTRHTSHNIHVNIHWIRTPDAHVHAKSYLIAHDIVYLPIKSVCLLALAAWLHTSTNIHIHTCTCNTHTLDCPSTVGEAWRWSKHISIVKYVHVSRLLAA